MAVDSVLGQGSTFTMRLPVIRKAGAKKPLAR